MFAIAIFASIFPAVVVAQYGGGPAPSPTSSAPVVVPSAPQDTPGQINVCISFLYEARALPQHFNQVDVAFQETFTFHPSNFSAPNGTQVTFYFPKSVLHFIDDLKIDRSFSSTGLDHSVTQSSFAEPCTYLTAAGNNSAGFDSGLQSAVTFNITIVDDTQPIWFHCKQVDGFIEPKIIVIDRLVSMGMVGAINAPTTGNTFEAFMAAAINIGNSEVTETGGPVTGGVNGVATAFPASDTGGASSSSSNAGQMSSPFNLPLALLAGISSSVLFFV
ncbi:hypothetical protein H0H92_003290 [Tricholoma furcatifolium]|nr:hypothetical protein H0H92_003290 [Tricholoma furcatifolium]